MLHIAGTAPRRVHDLDRGSARRGLYRAYVGYKRAGQPTPFRDTSRRCTSCLHSNQVNSPVWPGPSISRRGPYRSGSGLTWPAILSRGVVLNLQPDGNVDGVTAPGTRLASYNTSNALLMFYLLASSFLLQAHTHPIALQRYVPPDFRF